MTKNFEPGTDFREVIKDPAAAAAIANSLQLVQEICHGLSAQAGWWDKKGAQLQAHQILESNPDLPDDVISVLTAVSSEERNPAQQLCLIHSEVSEAMEGVRKNLMDDKLPHRKMEEVEVADAIVRLLDYAGGRGLDVAGALVEKMVFNITRPDHQPEAREGENGKQF